MLAISNKLDVKVDTGARVVKAIKFNDLCEHLRSVMSIFLNDKIFIFDLSRARNQSEFFKIMKLSDILSDYLSEYAIRTLYHYYYYDGQGRYYKIRGISIQNTSQFLISTNNTATLLDFIDDLKTYKISNLVLQLKRIDADYCFNLDRVLLEIPLNHTTEDNYIINGLEHTYPKYNLRSHILRLPVYTSITDLFAETSMYKAGVLQAKALDQITDEEKKFIEGYLAKGQVNTNLATPIMGTDNFNCDVRITDLNKLDAELKKIKKRRLPKQPPLETEISV